VKTLTPSIETHDNAVRMWGEALASLERLRRVTADRLNRDSLHREAGWALRKCAPTQMQLSLALDVHESSVSRMCNGNLVPLEEALTAETAAQVRALAILRAMRRRGVGYPGRRS
jgi:hypothetical protein